MTIPSVNLIKQIFAVVPPGIFIANKLKYGRKKLKENTHPFESANMSRSRFYTYKGNCDKNVNSNKDVNLNDQICELYLKPE